MRAVGCKYRLQTEGSERCSGCALRTEKLLSCCGTRTRSGLACPGSAERGVGCVSSLSPRDCPSVPALPHRPGAPRGLVGTARARRGQGPLAGPASPCDALRGRCCLSESPCRSPRLAVGVTGQCDSPGRFASPALQCRLLRECLSSLLASLQF